MPFSFPTDFTGFLILAADTIFEKTFIYMRCPRHVRIYIIPTTLFFSLYYLCSFIKGLVD
jgi:hypothetical protein